MPAQLAEQGKLAFSDPVSRYLPEYPREVAEKVTIHHLLTHTSGMGSYWNDCFFSVWADLRTVDDYLPLFRDDPLSFEPGEKFQYSNAGFVVLGAIIERVSGQDYFTYMREHIYEPAGMHESGSQGGTPIRALFEAVGTSIHSSSSVLLAAALICKGARLPDER